MTDAAMAVQAEVVMLNKGPNLAAGVSALDRVLRRMGENRMKKDPDVTRAPFLAQKNARLSEAARSPNRRYLFAAQMRCAG